MLISFVSRRQPSAGSGVALHLPRERRSASCACGRRRARWRGAGAARPREPRRQGALSAAAGRRGEVSVSDSLQPGLSSVPCLCGLAFESIFVSLTYLLGMVPC